MASSSAIWSSVATSGQLRPCFEEMVAASQGRLRTSSSARAKAGTLRGGTMRPQVSSMISGMPPTLVATTGRPAARASMTTLGQPSL